MSWVPDRQSCKGIRPLEPREPVGNGYRTVQRLTENWAPGFHLILTSISFRICRNLGPVLGGVGRHEEWSSPGSQRLTQWWGDRDTKAVTDSGIHMTTDLTFVLYCREVLGIPGIGEVRKGRLHTKS